MKDKQKDPPKACIKCGQPALMVRSVPNMENKGWYCPHCLYFDKAIGWSGSCEAPKVQMIGMDIEDIKAALCAA